MTSQLTMGLARAQSLKNQTVCSSNKPRRSLPLESRCILQWTCQVACVLLADLSHSHCEARASGWIYARIYRLDAPHHDVHAV